MQEQLIALLGQPVTHSKSPQMQNLAFQALELPYRYLAFDVAPQRLKAAISGLKALGFRGANVTIPHKVAILPFLDELTPLARGIGAVNTLCYQDGRLLGDNTDGQGYLASLLEEFPHLQLEKMSVGIAGAGGAARAVAFTLAHHGIGKLYIVNRHLEKGKALADSLREWVDAEAVPFHQFQKVASKLNLLIHATPVGMSPNTEESLIPVEWLHAEMIVSDLIYNPLETRLLREAKERGALIHNGIGMLVHQGALSFERWTGLKAPVELMRECLINSLQT